MVQRSLDTFLESQPSQREHGTLGEILALDLGNRSPPAPGSLHTLDAASAFLHEEDSGIGFVYSGWCQAALPHKRPADAEIWRITTDYVDLLVEPGHQIVNDDITPVGIPYGSRARLILLFLQGEALRTQSRDIPLGKSLHHWLTRLGIPICGKSMAAVRDQAKRIKSLPDDIPYNTGNAKRTYQPEHRR